MDRSAPLGTFRARVKAHCTMTVTKDAGPTMATPWGRAEREWSVYEAPNLNAQGPAGVAFEQRSGERVQLQACTAPSAGVPRAI